VARPLLVGGGESEGVLMGSCSIVLVVTGALTRAGTRTGEGDGEGKGLIIPALLALFFSTTAEAAFVFAEAATFTKFKLSSLNR
jgi:hypothetical protein